MATFPEFPAKIIAAVAVVASLVPGGVDRKRQCLNSCLAYASYTAYLHPQLTYQGLA